jgi:hypothetical protein
MLSRRRLCLGIGVLAAQWDTCMQPAAAAAPEGDQPQAGEVDQETTKKLLRQALRHPITLPHGRMLTASYHSPGLVR